MSSAICQNFVQNAWKKELCSNCFKSKDEHAEKPKPKPIQLISNEKVASIIKNGKKPRPKLSVCFLKDLTEVIGYGGEDWCSENEDEEEENENSEDDYVIESEEEESTKELQRITKENTDFNTTSLAEVVEVKKSYTQLLLGKPLVDASGKKQTLLVSVTPFGEDTKNNKDIIAEIKTNVVLTSYTKNEEEKFAKEEKSLLDEISETLENSKNPIQIMSKKKTQKDIVLNVIDSNKENISQDSSKQKEEKNTEVKEEKVTETKVVFTEKRVSLSRTPALKRDIEKPVIYQTSTAKIELLNSKNLKFNKETVNNNSKAKSEVNNNEKTEMIENKNDKKEITNNVKASAEDKEKVTGLPPPVPIKFSMPFPQSREQAGKPDGREDPVITELPPLPITPPPTLETQTSFFTHHTSDLRKTENSFKACHTQTLSTFSSDKCSEKNPLSKQDSTDSDSKSSKRRAPKPPPEDIAVPTYSRNSAGPMNIDSPVVREKKSENAHHLARLKSLKILSISTDSLATNGVEEKRKEKNKGRFSLKKFLRMGSSKDLPKITSENATLKTEECGEGAPQPKPRLVIVHPSELNGAKVEVVAKPIIDQVDYHANKQHNYSIPNGDYEVYNSPKTTKPPPPPRNHNDSGTSKPNLPHPPKSVEILNKQRQISRSNSNTKKTETVYANIGEVRSAIVPNKPVRTASMREREALQQKNLRKNLHNYEPINIRGKDSSENVYDYINSTRSSSPDSDSSRGKNSPKIKTVRLGKRSESSIDVSGDYFKYSNIPRSMSLTYCGSETESEIYAPYSFYGSESEVTEDDHDWIQNGRTHKLRSRKGRSIVHKNLEDNYGAVVVANHEALAQVLENIQQTSHIQLALRGLKSSPNLRWTDFSMKSGTTPMLVGRRAFHQALWGAQHVTLVVNAGTVTSSTLSLGTFNLTPVTEFSDLVPSCYLAISEEDKEDNKQVQATVSVLPWLQVNTIQSFSDLLKSKAQNHEDMWKDANFVMLQLVNALKTLQAQVQSLLNKERAVSLTQVKSILEFSLWGPSDVSLGSTIRERELALQRWLDLQRATVLHGLVCASTTHSL
ncbi:hypothetical protein NQ314_019051 [Rhamnusium bicolor]|uniref:Uncharacterized protein n=1 Tax=Rhamnusium bicolor TaxID=1586634 RepID=A0AAV8WQF3_9CUCU|nr:hypothetical protein NQ314_019051 [Rhamnusium bicolor]